MGDIESSVLECVRQDILPAPEYRSSDLTVASQGSLSGPRGERIRQAYASAGMIRAEFIRRLNALAALRGVELKTNNATVTKWEKGATPDTNTLVLIALVTNRKVDEFIEEASDVRVDTAKSAPAGISLTEITRSVHAAGITAPSDVEAVMADIEQAADGGTKSLALVDTVIKLWKRAHEAEAAHRFVRTTRTRVVNPGRPPRDEKR